MTNEIAFSVSGDPVPQGSMRAWKHPTTGAVVMTHSRKASLDKWRDAIRHEAQTLNQPCSAGPVELHTTFVFSRPKSLKRSVTRHTKRPDFDKLVRAVSDALTGVLWVDDSQIDHAVISKRYADKDEPPGVRITVSQVGV